MTRRTKPTRRKILRRGELAPEALAAARFAAHAGRCSSCSRTLWTRRPTWCPVGEELAHVYLAALDAGREGA